MTAVRRMARIVAVAALLASVGVALGFAAALMRPRPKSRYASLRQPIASDPRGAGGGA